MNFIYIWHGGRYRSQVLLSAIPTLGPDLEVKLTEFSNESQNICTLVYTAILSRPFNEFHLYFGMMVTIGLKFYSVLSLL